MTHRLLSAVLIVAVLAIGPARPAMAGTKDERQTAKVKAGVLGLGTGPEAKIEVKRRDATKVKGFVLSADEASFVVKDPQTGATTQVAYGDVSKVKGHNLNTGWTIAIGAGVVFALVLILVWTGAIGDAER